MIFNLGGGVAAPKLTGIAVTTQPATTIYNEGDSFNTSGMVVTAYFDDGSNEAVAGYIVSPSSLSFGTKTVTISYTLDGITMTDTVNITTRRYLIKEGVGALYAPTIDKGSPVTVTTNTSGLTVNTSPTASGWESWANIYWSQSFTGVSAVKAEMTCSQRGNLGLLVVKNAIEDVNALGQVTWTVSSARKIYSINTASISGTRLLIFGAGEGDKFVVQNLWLES